MKRIAALYDIHGNIDALESVLADVRKEYPDLIVVGGDVFPGPFAIECLELLLGIDIPVRFLHGNGDRETLAELRGGASSSLPDGVRKILAWHARQLDQRQADELSSWPSTRRIRVDDLGDIVFCHATLRNDTEIFTRNTSAEKVLPMFDEADAQVVICGHTHMQFDRRVGGLRIANAGSVGMPFGEPGACWLQVGPELHFRHTKYDLEAAAARILATSFPGAKEFAESSVLHPPSEAVMLERYG